MVDTVDSFSDIERYDIHQVEAGVTAPENGIDELVDPLC